MMTQPSQCLSFPPLSSSSPSLPCVAQYECLVEGCPETFMHVRTRRAHLVAVHQFPRSFQVGPPKPKKARGRGRARGGRGGRGRAKFDKDFART